MTLLDQRGSPFYSELYPARIYEAFDSIPELIWRTLLHIESRELLNERYPRRNPAVEWDRLARGIGEIGLRTIGSERNVPGGSTLATQLEKFRHSPEGRTANPRAKLAQMFGASLRAYRDGPETLASRQRIVCDYLNSVPLAAQLGHGEVIGLADGLWAWYGTPFDDANRLLTNASENTGEAELRALIYRQALSLLVAQRRPSYYLADADGRKALGPLTDRYLHLLAHDGIIPKELADRASRTTLSFLSRAPERGPRSFVEHKAADQVRADLLTLTGRPTFYALDRLDVTVSTTFDQRLQDGVISLFDSLRSRDFARRRGFTEDRLLGAQDPARVTYSFTLLESTPFGNVVRAQTDSHDGPLSLTEAGRLELGSTAKLRTLVTYLEVVAELHHRLSRLDPSERAHLPIAIDDRLTRWAIEYLTANPEETLRTMLEAAMQRRYSANPKERFATGGGVQTFSNFDRASNDLTLSVADAFQQSVNLPFVRVMRDVVAYHVHRRPESAGQVLEDPTNPSRQRYLSLFADREGSRFVRRFHGKYADVAASEILERLVRDRRLSPLRLAYSYRAVAPEASAELFESFVRTHSPDVTLTPRAIAMLFRQSAPLNRDLNDLGYLARIHPLELWVVRYLINHPHAPMKEVLEASANARQAVYHWLFRSQNLSAQNDRIRSILELEAFDDIHASWKRLGYPFENIVPSLGTAIGSSGDRPMALAELVGILVDDGVRRPVVRVTGLSFAAGTPFETRLVRQPVTGERVLDQDVAAIARAAMLDVVENGTGRRVRNAVHSPSATPLSVGGKTGTGDNRFRVFGPGGRLVEDRVVNRTATFAFFLGEKHFGVVTAYVSGAAAAGYHFTSALPTEIMRQLGPLLEETL